MTTTSSDTKTLVKILIGTAWIDGKIQPEEREYLHRIAQEKGVADEPEIQPLLYEFRPVSPEECYGWVKQYLGDRPSSESCQQLLEAISGLIYSDGTVATEEAKLLTELQTLESSSDNNSNSVIKAIRNLYQRWIAKLE
ncbi:MAG: TerB family tellurite resistance protein [Oscillatoriales cyanobacterium C42_A2020_001]|nr:TerB family tellurite resistance protein [Leptolyngbyaceae cyanobacterium C42_A2020_001]